MSHAHLTQKPDRHLAKHEATGVSLKYKLASIAFDSHWASHRNSVPQFHALQGGFRVWRITKQFCSVLSNIRRRHLNYGKWFITLSAQGATIFNCQETDPGKVSGEALSKYFLASPQVLSALTPC